MLNLNSDSMIAAENCIGILKASVINTDPNEKTNYRA
jgi:hypothetical protein